MERKFPMKICDFNLDSVSVNFGLGLTNKQHQIAAST